MWGSQKVFIVCFWLLNEHCRILDSIGLALSCFTSNEYLWSKKVTKITNNLMNPYFVFQQRFGRISFQNLMMKNSLSELQ